MTVPARQEGGSMSNGASASSWLRHAEHAYNVAGTLQPVSGNSKSQNPSSKQIPKDKSQTQTFRFRVWNLVLDPCLCFGICDLVLRTMREAKPALGFPKKLGPIPRIDFTVRKSDIRTCGEDGGTDLRGFYRRRPSASKS